LLPELAKLALAGCATPAQRAQYAEANLIAQNNTDDATCRSYGAVPGSDAYVACRMRLTQIRANEDAQASAQDAQRRMLMMSCGFRMMSGGQC